MRAFLKSGFWWHFVGGFALGAIGLVTFQPAAATRALADHLTAVAHLQG